MKLKLYRIIVTILLLLFVYIAVSIWVSSNYLSVKEYEFTTDKATQEITLVVLSDLHGHEFGNSNEQLVEKIGEQSPDLILLDGDFLNENSENAAVSCKLVDKLVEIAPVYFSLGNHEFSYIENNHPELIQQLEKAGAVVLDKGYVDLEVGQNSLRLGGYMIMHLEWEVI